MRKAEQTRAHCNGCGHQTKHRVLFKHGTRDEDEQYGVYGTDDYEVLECCGCESVCLRETSWWAPDDSTRVTVYPPRVARRAPDWMFRLPARTKAVLQEVYTALHSNSRRLAMMGARTVVDLVALDYVGDVGGFKAKLRALEKQGVIGSKAVDVLDAAIDAGSAAAHRGHEPSSTDVNSVIDIIEHLLQGVYVLDRKATSLKRSTPRRPAPRKP